MERIYINRECCVAYTIMALHSILHSANKERTIEDFIAEIRSAFEIYTDEIKLLNVANKILEEDEKNKIYLNIGDEKIGINIEECAKYMGVSKQLMAEMVRMPDFPCIKFKRKILINKSKVQEWLDNNSGKRIRY